MKIGKITLKNKFILAPMAGYTTLAVRSVAAQNGAGLTVTEMVSCKGLLYQNQKTQELLATSDAEQVKCVQLFGRQPSDFERCAHLPQLEKFDIIDINMGCPVKKVVANGEGSALISDPKTAAALIKALKNAGKTATAKTRLSPTTDQTVAFVSALFDAGADMVALHARTPDQMYRGAADFDQFAFIKQKIGMPMALSGDVVDQNSLKKAEQTGADFIMIGRGALINTAIFADFAPDPLKKRAEHKKLVMEIFDLMCQIEGDDAAVKNFRKFIPYVLKNNTLQNNICTKSRRHAINFISDARALKAELADIFGDD